MPGPDRPASPLEARLRVRIAREGPLSIAAFMRAALTDPEHGYYTTGDPFGARGDFVTAPEISQMFGELLGLWCADAWQRLGAPDPVLLVELGPGRGTLLTDALRALRAAPAFRRALRLNLVEISPVLRARQAEVLAGLAEAVWHEEFATVPEGPLLVLANEFFDALPIRQFVRTGAGWCERMVAVAEDGALGFALGPARAEAPALLPAALRAAPVGALVEASEARTRLAGTLGRRVAAGGAALILDYGHARPGVGETLQAVRRHAAQPVLEAPGTADLTAHVDFAALAEAAEAAGARAHGPIAQGRFLRALGIEARAARLLAGATPAQAMEIRAGLERLTGAAAMGRLFQVLALTPPRLAAPAGFGQAAA